MDQKLPTKSISKKPGSTQIIKWLPVLIIFIIALIVRGFILFNSELMPGVNAVYYPVQVRAIIQKGGLGFPDLPLVFYLNAFLASVISFLKLAGLEDSIMFSCRFIDMLVPSIVVFPAFLLARSIIAEKGPSAKINFCITRWAPYLVAAFSILGISALVMMADMQKNAIGIMWGMWYLYFFYKSTKDKEIKFYILAGLFFALTGLSHLGAFGMVLAFSLSYIVYYFLLQQDKRTHILKWLAILAIPFAALLGLVFILFDASRIERLLGVIVMPFQIFTNPVILSMISGDYPISPFDLGAVFLANFLAILSLILIVRKSAVMKMVDTVFLFATVFTTLIMASFFLDPEWSNRLYMMCYIPIALMTIFFFQYISDSKKLLPLAVFMSFIIVIPTIGMFEMRSEPCITEEAYADLFEIKKEVSPTNKSLIIARHGLEWWTAWVLEVDVAQRLDRESSVFEEYDNIYYINQKKGKSDFGPFGPGSGGFPEPVIPDSAEIVFEDDFFKLALVQEKDLQNETDFDKERNFDHDPVDR